VKGKMWGGFFPGITTQGLHHSGQASWELGHWEQEGPLCPILVPFGRWRHRCGLLSITWVSGRDGSQAQESRPLARVLAPEPRLLKISGFWEVLCLVTIKKNYI
jgi:hypothetical protein